MTSTRTPVEVAAGVLIRRDGRFLLASRPAGKPYASYWEFPGGKVEGGESVAEALARELHEELGIRIGHSLSMGRACLRLSTCAGAAAFSSGV